jgi:hypothetical protein
MTRENKMEKTMKTKLAIGTFAVALGVASLLPTSSYAMRAEALDDTWGTPAKIEKVENGSEIRYFKINLSSNDSYRIFEVRTDGKVIDRGFSSDAAAKCYYQHGENYVGA